MSRMIRHENSGYNPWATRVDERVRCSVCGFAGIDPEKMQQPDQAVFTTVTTGTTYAPTTGDAVEDLSDIDRTTHTQIGLYAGCPFCGSPKWADGSAPDLKW